jgi:hypothetical protein
MHDESGQDEDALDWKHSGVGIVSFTIACIVGPLEVILLVVNASLGGQVHEAPRILIAFVVGMAFGMIVTLGGILGLLGLTQQRRQKVFPILGLIGNVLVGLATALLTVINLLAERP